MRGEKTQNILKNYTNLVNRLKLSQKDKSDKSQPQQQEKGGADFGQTQTLASMRGAK